MIVNCRSSVADTTPFGIQAEVTLKTNFFATRDMLTHFLPLIKAGGKDTEQEPRPNRASNCNITGFSGDVQEEKLNSLSATVTELF